MKNVRKLSATMILTLVISCSAFAGVISGGKATPAPTTTVASDGVISGGKATPAAGDISLGGLISGGFTQLLSVVIGIVLR